MTRLWSTGALLVALTGCGLHSQPKPATIDHAWVERGIARSILNQASIVAHVSCPTDIPIVAGNTFHCVAKGDGQTALYTVTIENKEGAITWKGDTAP